MAGSSRMASAIFSGIVVVIFSMVGAEVATIAAAEFGRSRARRRQGDQPVVVRICVFFIGSIFLLAVILPWNSERLGASPYVAASRRWALPGRRTS